MKKTVKPKTRAAKQSPTRPAHATDRAALPGQAVLVLQGGGTLGAFQVGAYEALHEAGIEPDWVIGTSIGAINGAIIAGNPPEQRVARLHAFWEGVQQTSGNGVPAFLAAFGQTMANLTTITRGVPTFLCRANKRCKARMRVSAWRTPRTTPPNRCAPPSPNSSISITSMRGTHA